MTPKPGAEAKPNPSSVAPLLSALVITLAFVRLPHRALGTDVDSAWCSVLDYVRQQGLQFGADLAFTYGPLGFLTMPCRSVFSAGIQTIGSAFLCLMITIGVCLVAWRLAIAWRLILIATFICLVANLHAGADLLLDLGLLCWGLLCLLESGSRLRISILCFTALAVLGSLSKITFLFTAAFSIGLIGLDLVLRGRGNLGFGMAALFCAGFLAGWVLAGQNVTHLGAFISLGWTIASSYDQTMGKEASNIVCWGGIITLLLGVTAILIRSLTVFDRSDLAYRWRRAVGFIWFSGFLFIAWKHGFVRLDDYHIELFLGFAAILALALGALPCARVGPRAWARCVALACCAVSFLTLQRHFEPGLMNYCVFRPFDTFAENLRSLAHPVRHRRALDEQEDSERRMAELPELKKILGSASVDVFGNEQSYAILNGLNYRPRPVFQSYIAYTPSLMKLNERFYASSSAPDFVLFKLAPIDHRFPALEDALLFRRLLMNSELVASEGRFLLLKPASSHSPALTLLREGSIRPGEPLSLESYGDANIWMELDLAPTWRGKLRQFLYKPPELRLTALRRAPESPASFRAPAPMMTAGFLASPLLRRSEDVQAFFQGTNVLRPLAYSVSLNSGDEGFWADKVRFRIFKIDNKRAD